MAILQLNPAYPVYIEPHDKCPGGKALAHLVIDYGQEAHLTWVCFLDSDGQCWSVENPYIRMQFNTSVGRFNNSDEFSDFSDFDINFQNKKLAENFGAGGSGNDE